MTKRHNPGRRERAAGKRYGRARVLLSGMGADQSPLKLGKKKLGINCRKTFPDRTSRHLPVAETENNA
jgi:hypothetical protein